MLCFQALCQIICLFMYFYYFQESRDVMFSGTVPYYLFIYVFLLFPEVQKCYVFRHCARLFVYLCISIISRSSEMLCFQALCQIIYLFMYFYYFLESRNVMFSGTVPDYLFIYVFLLFPGVQKCYVFRHCVRLFIYLCISIISRSPEMLCSPSWELELRPLGVATGNALSVTRSEDTYEKTPPVGRRQPMTSLPAYHNISAAGRIHHQLFRLH